MGFISGSIRGLAVLVDAEGCDQSEVLCRLPLDKIMEALPLSRSVQASQTELTWTITLVGVWMNWAKVRSPWKMALAFVCGPLAMPVMVPFRCRAPSE